MYQALYRKWRPRTFDDVVGQEQVTETLKNQIISGRLSHAYLFIGTRGTGKTSCAKILARAVNCENPENGNPCNKCRSCLGIEDGSVMDVVELDAASNNGVDNVRALRDEAVFSPAIVKKRVYIIDEVHMLSTSAFNALLKILEEPPEHLMFILATTEMIKVPATILSRCQRHSFRRIDTELMAGRISYVAAQENMTLDADAAALLARLADGSMRDALSLLDQCSGVEHITTESVLSRIGLAGNMRIAELLVFIADGRVPEALSAFDSLWRDGRDPAALLSELNSLLRDILIMKVAPKSGADLLSGGFDMTTLRAFVPRLDEAQIIAHMDAISSRLAVLRDGRDPRTAAELCIVGMCEPSLAYKAPTGTPGHTNPKPAAAADVPTKMSSQTAAAPTQPDTARQDSSSPAAETSTAPTMLETAPDPAPRQTAPVFKPVAAEETPPWDDAPPQYPPSEVKSSPAENTPIPEEAPTADSVAPPTVSSPDSWALVLEDIMKNVPVFIRVHFEGSRAEFSDAAADVYVADAFKQSMLDNAQTKDTIKQSVNRVLGRNLPIRILVSDRPNTTPASAPSGKKLDDLLKFGNVKVE